MKTLLYKEFRLASHPTTFLFPLLSAMLLIPNYPYYVVFFYTTLGIFFVCLSGRENHDIFYTMLLPVEKRSLVRARMLFAVCMEAVQLVLAVPFALEGTCPALPLRCAVGSNVSAQRGIARRRGQRRRGDGGGRRPVQGSLGDGIVRAAAGGQLA